MSKVSVFAEFSFSEGRDEEISEVLAALVAAVESDNDVEVYSYHRCDDGTYRFFGVMKNREAAQNHAENKEIAAVMPKLMKLLDRQPKVIMAEPLTAKGLDI